MKNLLNVSAALLLCISGPALAGSGYDTCVKEEKNLKTRETAECNGLRYLLNPSACYATQKVLKEYKSGKCRDIGIAEGVDFTARTIIPEKKSSSTAGSPGETSSHSGILDTVTSPPVTDIPSSPAVGVRAEPGVVRQEATIEQLKEENIRLKAEVSRLTAELEQFGKACR